MKTLIYLFWSLKKYYERVWLVKGQYNWTILAFSLPYNLPIMIISGIFSKEFIIPFLGLEIKNEFWKMIVIMLFPSIIFFLLAQPLKLLFPKKKIESLIYTKEEIKKYRLNILYFVIGLVVLIVLRIMYVWYVK